MSLSVAVLISEGRHPVSGNPRPADEDARALEMALCLPAAQITVLHAGDAASPALRGYLGMGVAIVSVLPTAPFHDPLEPLAKALSDAWPDLIFTGTRAENGEGSGFLPYAIAARLGRPVLSNICKLTVRGDRVDAVQALPRGQRRGLRAPLPAVIAVGKAAPSPRQSAYAKARRGQITIDESCAIASPPPTWTAAPARAQIKRLKGIDPNASAEERLAAATAMAGGKSEMLSGLSHDEAADKLLQYWAERGVRPRAVQDILVQSERSIP